MSMEDVLSDLNQKTEGNQAAPRPIVTPDQEVWVRNQVLLAMRMAVALHAEVTVRADGTALKSGLNGIADGVALEIIHTLNLSPSYVNLQRK